jgi:hypothetical protein
MQTHDTANALWITLLNRHASCIASVYMRTVHISNEVYQRDKVKEDVKAGATARVGRREMHF